MNLKNNLLKHFKNRKIKSQKKDNINNKNTKIYRFHTKEKNKIKIC